MLVKYKKQWLVGDWFRGRIAQQINIIDEIISKKGIALIPSSL